MKRFLNAICLFIFISVAISSCTDKNAIIDQNVAIVNHNWQYLNKVKFAVKIDNENIPYNLYFNLRVTAAYKYSNIFILIAQQTANKKSQTNRYEFKLANKDGEWLGEGSGNLYSYQVPFKSNYKFPSKGTYLFEIEQNMRDNPLREVSDVGLRIEKAQ